MSISGIMKKAALPVLAAALVLGAAAGPSASYFTTYVTAQGGETVYLYDVRVTPHETVDANTKTITVENTGAVECYARVRVAASVDVPVAYAGEGWTDGGDGYWYYGAILQPGETSGELKAQITLPTSGPEKPIPDGTVVNVVVLSECAKVFYEDSGMPKPNGPDYEGWDLTAKEG